MRDAFHKKRKYFLEESVTKYKKDFQDLKKYFKQFGTKNLKKIFWGAFCNKRKNTFMGIFCLNETEQAGRGKINIKDFFKQFETRNYKIYFKKDAFCKKRKDIFFQWLNIKKSKANWNKNQKDILTKAHFTTKQKNLYGDL